MNLKRIDKRVARRLYDGGATVYAMPHKYRIDNDWFQPFEWSNASGHDFNKLCNGAEFYNCCYETGYYLAFYTEVK